MKEYIQAVLRESFQFQSVERVISLMLLRGQSHGRVLETAQAKRAAAGRAEESRQPPRWISRAPSRDAHSQPLESYDLLPVPAGP